MTSKQYGASCGSEIININYFSYIDNYIFGCKYQEGISLIKLKDYDIELLNYEINCITISFTECSKFRNYDIIFLIYEGKYELISNFICDSSTTQVHDFPESLRINPNQYTKPSDLPNSNFIPLIAFPTIIPTIIPKIIQTTIPIIQKIIQTYIPTTISANISTIIQKNIPMTILTTIITTIPTMVPKTCPIPTNIPTTIIIANLPKITTTFPKTIPTTIPTKIQTTIPKTIQTIISSTFIATIPKNIQAITTIPKTDTPSISQYIPIKNLTILTYTYYPIITTIFEPIITEIINIEKESIMKDIYSIMGNISLNQIYKKIGNNYTILIYPTNSSFLASMTHANFSECETILRDHYHIPDSSILTFIQIEIKNSDSKSLINKVEYQAYDGNNNTFLDLSLCKDVNIEIFYSIKKNL